MPVEKSQRAGECIRDNRILHVPVKAMPSSGHGDEFMLNALPGPTPGAMPDTRVIFTHL